MRFQKKIYHLLAESPVVTIFGHVNPDEDCYGSQIGLRDTLRATFPGKRVYALGSGSPRLFSYVGEMDEVDDEEIVRSVAVVVDVGDQPRIEDQRFKLAKKIIKIDHHIFTEAFADYEWIDTGYVAAAEMIADFLVSHHCHIPVTAARALYAGISSDSGRFQYKPTGERTLTLAAKMVHYGAIPNELYQQIYIFNPRFVRLKSEIISQFKTDGQVAYLLVTQKYLQEKNFSSSDAYGLVNGIGNMEGFPIWVSFVEREDGIVNCELRARNLNIQPVAHLFGGGGHAQAAGCRLNSLMDVNSVLTALNKVSKGDDETDV